MKCLKCGRELVQDVTRTLTGLTGVISIDELKDMHTTAHAREDIWAAMDTLFKREISAKDRGEDRMALAYAEAVALIRNAMEPPKFEGR